MSSDSWEDFSARRAGYLDGDREIVEESNQFFLLIFMQQSSEVKQ
jgi:hypothetical protein